MKLINSKLLATGLIIFLLFSTSITAFAANLNKSNNVEQEKTQQKDLINKEEAVPDYHTFSGKVTAISFNSVIHVQVENNEGMTATLVISQDTKIIGNKLVAVGDWVTGFYNAKNPMIMIYPPQYSLDILLIASEIGEEYTYFTGIVKTISESTAVKGLKTVFVEGKDGLTANIVISKDAYIVQGKEIKVGAEITAFYNKNAPMIMIYPPNYSAQVVVVNQDNAVEEVVEPDKILLGSVSGKVTKIKKITSKIKHVYVEDSKGNTTVCVVTADSYVVDNKNIKVGSKITGYYNVNAPIFTIYPPQYTMDLIIVNAKKHVNYQSITGTVKKITNSKTVKGQQTLYIENETGAANVVFTKDTILAKKDKVKVGSVITGYYDGDAANITIYPPNYTANIIRVIKNVEKTEGKGKESNKGNKK